MGNVMVLVVREYMLLRMSGNGGWRQCCGIMDDEPGSIWNRGGSGAIWLDECGTLSTSQEGYGVVGGDEFVLLGIEILKQKEGREGGREGSGSVIPAPSLSSAAFSSSATLFNCSRNAIVRFVVSSSDYCELTPL